MCLSRVINTFKQEVKVGYKFFYDVNRYGKNYETLPPTEVVTSIKRTRLFIGQWTKDTSYGQITSDDGKTYQAGYHIFKTKQGAQKSGYGGNLYKVEYTDLVAEGYENRIRVDIARSIRIVSKVY